MTLERFRKLLKKINPNLRVRIRGVGDVAGLFVGYSGKSGYICRLSKGELHLNGFRHMVQDPQNTMRLTEGNIKKRGRKTLINLLRNYRWITNHKQRTMLTFGIEYPDEEVKGLVGTDQYA